MKKFIKNNLIGIITGIIISGTVGVIAATTISSKNVTYQNKTVNTALDELYNEATTGKELVAAAITNKGITTTSNDTYETMATNINSIDSDHTEINQKINNLESKHNSDIASLTGNINNLSVFPDYSNRRIILDRSEISTIKPYTFNDDGYVLIFFDEIRNVRLTDGVYVDINEMTVFRLLNLNGYFSTPLFLVRKGNTIKIWKDADTTGKAEIVFIPIK